MLGTQTVVVVVDEATTDGEIVGGASSGAAMAAPVLSAPQCLQTLATDGCLLATTTVRFEWTAVAGTDHYLINKNGEFSTTTDTTFSPTIKDFSDYTLEVVAIDSVGNASATSTQKVSVASIPIAINEIAWMGTVASTTREWFELKNNTTHTIDLSQWELRAKEGAPHIKFTKTIAPHAYLIFERIDNTTVSDIEAHQTYKGSLENSGKQLNLSYASTTFNQTPTGKWAGGYNSTTSRQTMERYSSRESGTDPENWGTNLGYIKNGIDASGKEIEGTPGAQNSVSALINKGEDITSDFTLTADEERYVVPNQLWVDASSTLTIEPGVVIQFYSGGVWVNGEIDARGTAENPIIFNSFSKKRAGDFWIDNATGTSTFEHARFENMNTVFTVDGGVLEIRNSEFVNTEGGVGVSGASSTVLIENTNFASSTSDTIGVYNGGIVRIASSTITNQLDGDAIGVYGAALLMASTTIDGVHDGNGIGAYDSFVSVASSTIRNTEGDAIGAYYSTMTIASTTIDGVSDGSGVAVYGGTLSIASSTIRNVSGGGISLYSATSTISNVTVENTGYVGIEVGGGTTTITGTTVSGVDGWAGIYVDEGALSISSSTIKNVADYGIYVDKATSTISNVVVENGGGTGIDIYQGNATVTDTTVSGFVDSGISVDSPSEPVVIMGGEISGNAIGVEMDHADSVIITDESSVHDNIIDIVTLPEPTA